MEVMTHTPLINFNHLTAFGQCKFDETIGDKKVFNGMALTSFDPKQKFEEICVNILDGNHHVSRILLERLLFTLLDTQDKNDTNKSVVTNSLINVFNTVTNKYAEYIQHTVLEGTFSINDFLNRYQQLFDNTKLLRNAISYYDRNMRYENGKFSLIVLMKNMSLYNNVINRTYFMSKTQNNQYLYEILCNYLAEDENMNLDNIVAVFKIYQFYNRLGSVSAIKEADRDKYFNKELIKKFTISTGSAKLINTMLTTVNDMIKGLSKETNEEKIQNLTNHLRDLLLMGVNIGDRDLFLMMYKNMMTERLLTYRSDPQVEQQILKIFFDMRYEPELYAKMRYQLWDAIISRKHDEVFRNFSIKKTTDKFKDIDLTKLRKDACNFMIMRSHAWETKEFDQYNVPDVVAVYMAIFNSYYLREFRDQTLTFLHNQSTGVLTMKLANDVDYNIQMTLPQMYVLLTICKMESVTPKEISEKLNIPLPKLGRILNSLIEVSLVKKEKGANNNPQVPFSINWNCSFDEKDIDIISVYKKFINPQSNPVKSVQNQPKDEINAVILNAKIMMLMTKVKSLPLESLKTEVNKIMEKTVPEVVLMNELTRLVEANRLEFNAETNTYKHKETNSTELDDSDSEDENEPKTDVDQPANVPVVGEPANVPVVGEPANVPVVVPNEQMPPFPVVSADVPVSVSDSVQVVQVVQVVDVVDEVQYDEKIDVIDKIEFKIMDNVPDGKPDGVLVSELYGGAEPKRAGIIDPKLGIANQYDQHDQCESKSDESKSDEHQAELSSIDADDYEESEPEVSDGSDVSIIVEKVQIVNTSVSEEYIAPILPVMQESVPVQANELKQQEQQPMKKHSNHKRDNKKGSKKNKKHYH
ncbi:MAG: cullin family protein [Terrestrivirus sp.]|uniref:Cullin family protein n=1 Tax=Terrestrivirus sp. TaxID=2487775 RepID=A0A3G4ZNF5_9VIRU|nr:MAG: cullin family protein [Terrestrivirus sp.]